MAPKKKGGNKKYDDDWEAELGESIAPSTPADNEAGEAPPEEEEAGGGLLAALKKTKQKKGKKGKNQQNDFVEGEDAAASPAAESKEPEEGDLDEEDVFAGNSKAAKETAAAAKAKLAAEEKKAAEEAPKMKSKKEKEREKKEREKQRKREQAAKKKTTGPAPAKEEPKKEESPSAEPSPSASPAPEPAAAGGKKKKLPPHLAAIQRQQELLRQQREEEERLRAEEKKRREEEDAKFAEEERKKEEARQKKKEREREKREQLKKEGKYMTKAQREQRERHEAQMKALLAGGNATVAGLAGDSAEKKKAVYDKKKKRGPKKQEEDLEAAAARAEEKRKAEEEERKKKEEEERKKKEEEEKAAAAAARDDGIPDSWDAESDEDVKDNWDDDSEAEEQKKVEKATEKKKAEEEKEKEAKAKAEAEASKAKKDVESESESESESDSDDEQSAAKRATAQRKAEAAKRREEKHEAALAARSKDNLRSPICCIMGHVDTGKTKLLDKVRQTNVQEGEAGGITQQIGATYFPVEALQQKIAVVNKDNSFEFKVPGLLVIDTPGHESFSNLRSRGSSLCNIAILVVDIMHGLEPQTLESMRMLRDRKTPFIVALNKIDRLYGWKKIDNNGVQDSLAFQGKAVLSEFKDRVEKTKLAFAEQGFNSELYWKNKNMSRYVSLVPTSAHTGEGVPDMLKLLTQLTQERMTNKLMYLSEVECTVLEVKVIEGLGTTIDVVLSNGVLKEGDRIVLCGVNGPIATNIRALLTPAPLKELRLKSAYVHNKEVKASLGVKIAANDLEQAIAGSRLLVVGPDEDEDDLCDEVMSDLEQLLSKVSKDNRGVTVQASTLGSLEALLEFLRASKIPVANISIGPVYKRDVMRAGTMLEKAKQFAVMLCFDVKVDKEAQAYADEVGIKIFTADIIYHLFDDFTKHMESIKQEKKEENKMAAVFPCVLKPVAVFNKTSPIVVGVDVVEGNLRLLTPIVAVKTNPNTGKKEVINLGRVQSIEREHKQIPICKKGQPSVAVKIEGSNQPSYGRHLEEEDNLYSLISRNSIDTLKEHYRSDVSMDEWVLIKKLKTLFDIP